MYVNINYEYNFSYSFFQLCLCLLQCSFLRYVYYLSFQVNIILATYGAMLTLCLFHIKLKRMSRFGGIIYVYVLKSLWVLCCVSWKHTFSWRYLSNPEQSRFTDCIGSPHHPCVTDLVWPWNLTLLGILELQSLYDYELCKWKENMKLSVSRILQR